MKRGIRIGELIKRINRKLAPQQEALRTTRGGPFSNMRVDLGDYYVADDYGLNLELETHVDPEQLGCELGVLRNWESVIDVAA